MYCLLVAFVCLSGLVQDQSDQGSKDQKKDIFAVLWEMPESHVTVSRMGDDDQPLDPEAQVVVHEQGKGQGCVDQTLYPKFRGASIPEAPVRVDLPTQPHNTAPIRIEAALVNTVSADESGEWVKLKNITEDTEFELVNWYLCDRVGRKKVLSGKLKPGESITIELTRESQDSMMLRNAGGWILLFQGEVRRAAVAYGKGLQGQPIDF